MNSQKSIQRCSLLRLFLILFCWHLVSYVILTGLLTPCLRAWAASPIDYIRTSNVEPQVFLIIAVMNIKELLPGWHWLVLLLLFLLIRGLFTPAVQGAAVLYGMQLSLARSFHRVLHRIKPFLGQAVFHFVLVAVLALAGVVLAYWSVYYSSLRWLFWVLLVLAECVSLWNFAGKASLAEGDSWLSAAAGSLRMILSVKGAIRTVAFLFLDTILLVTAAAIKALPLAAAPIAALAVLAGLTSVKYYLVLS